MSIIKDEQSESGFKLEMKTFRAGPDAIKYANELENDENNLNAVYVRAKDEQQLRDAYKNYFSNSVDFVDLLADAGIE